MSIFHRPVCYTLLLFPLLFSKTVSSEETISYFIVPVGSKFVFNDTGENQSLAPGASFLPTTIFTCPTNQAYKVTKKTALKGSGLKEFDWYLYTCITELKAGDPAVEGLSTVKSVEVIKPNGQLSTKKDILGLDTKITNLEETVRVLTEKIDEKISQAITPVGNTLGTLRQEHDKHAHEANGEIFQRNGTQ